MLPILPMRCLDLRLVPVKDGVFKQALLFTARAIAPAAILHSAETVRMLDKLVWFLMDGSIKMKANVEYLTKVIFQESAYELILMLVCHLQNLVLMVLFLGLGLELILTMKIQKA